jgi:hypothetical protein
LFFSIASARDAAAREVRHDHVVDSAARGDNKRREEANFMYA